MKKFFDNLNSLIILVATDTFVIILGFIIAFVLRDLLSNFITIPTLISSDPLEYQLSVWWVIPLYLVVMWTQGLYSERRPFWQETKSIIKAVVVSALLMYTIVSLGRLSPFVSRIIFILHPFIILVLLPIFRRYAKIILFRLGFWKKPIIEVRVNQSKTLNEIWASNGFIGYSVVKSFPISLDSSDNIKHNAEAVAEYVKNNHISTVAVATKDTNEQYFSELIERLFFLVPQVIIVPEFISFDIMNAEIYHLMYENRFMFDIKKGLITPYNKMIKRTIDIIVSLLAIIAFSPIMLAVSLIILIMDGRPLVYTQDRFGKDGKVFKFRKFRSMYKNNDEILKEYLDKFPKKKAEWTEYQKLRGYDPRLIKGIGWIIRKLDLDELPQLFNVLIGEMSIIGPRPYLPREKDLIGNYLPRILSIKPGITGLWQATGRNDFTFKQRIAIDVWYIQNWSLWLDFVIICKTAKKILG